MCEIGGQSIFKWMFLTPLAIVDEATGNVNKPNDSTTTTTTAASPTGASSTASSSSSTTSTADAQRSRAAAAAATGIKTSAQGLGDATTTRKTLLGQ